MSRSRRKTPKMTGSEGRNSSSRKFRKRRASKSVRRYKGDVSDGKWYKKLYCSWNIRDYRPQCWDEESWCYKEILRK